MKTEHERVAAIPGTTLNLQSRRRARWRVAGSLSAVMIALYAGFILLIAYAPQSLAITLRPGMSLGILLGCAVIVAAWRSGKIMRRLQRDIAEGKALDDTITLADPAVLKQLTDSYGGSVKTEHERVAAIPGTTLNLQSRRRARWRVAGSLSAVMIALYAGFILLIAYAPQSLAITLRPGMSLGILLGCAVIVAAWILIGVYVRWANVHIDTAGVVSAVRR